MFNITYNTFKPNIIQQIIISKYSNNMHQNTSLVQSCTYKAQCILSIFIICINRFVVCIFALLSINFCPVIGQAAQCWTTQRQVRFILSPKALRPGAWLDMQSWSNWSTKEHLPALRATPKCTKPFAKKVVVCQTWSIAWAQGKREGGLGQSRN